MRVKLPVFKIVYIKKLQSERDIIQNPNDLQITYFTDTFLDFHSSVEM